MKLVLNCNKCVSATQRQNVPHFAKHVASQSLLPHANIICKRNSWVLMKTRKCSQRVRHKLHTYAHQLPPCLSAHQYVRMNNSVPAKRVFMKVQQRVAWSKFIDVSENPSVSNFEIHGQIDMLQDYTIHIAEDNNFQDYCLESLKFQLGDKKCSFFFFRVLLKSVLVHKFRLKSHRNNRRCIL